MIIYISISCKDEPFVKTSCASNYLNHYIQPYQIQSLAASFGVILSVIISKEGNVAQCFHIIINPFVYLFNKCLRLDNAAYFVTFLKQFSMLWEDTSFFWNNPNMEAFSLNLGTIQKILLAWWRYVYICLTTLYLS